MTGRIIDAVVGLPADYPKLSRRERRAVREEYVRRQGGKCYHCSASLDGQPTDAVLAKRIDKSLFPPTFFDWPVHLHHDHFTGMTIGAVHCRCNAVLWQYHGE